MDTNNTISKPMILVREEVIDSLVATINNSGLPLFVIEPILKDLLNEVRIGVKKEYESEKSNYEKLLNDNKQIVVDDKK